MRPLSSSGFAPLLASVGLIVLLVGAAGPAAADGGESDWTPSTAGSSAGKSAAGAGSSSAASGEAGEPTGAAVVPAPSRSSAASRPPSSPGTPTSQRTSGPGTATSDTGTTNPETVGAASESGGVPLWLIAVALAVVVTGGTLVVRRLRRHAPGVIAGAELTPEPGAPPASRTVQQPVQPSGPPRIAVPDDMSAWSWDHLTADERAAYEQAMRSLGRS